MTRTLRRATGVHITKSVGQAKSQWAHAALVVNVDGWTRQLNLSSIYAELWMIAALMAAAMPRACALASTGTVTQPNPALTAHTRRLGRVTLRAAAAATVGMEVGLRAATHAAMRRPRRITVLCTTRACVRLVHANPARSVTVRVRGVHVYLRYTY